MSFFAIKVFARPVITAASLNSPHCLGMRIRECFFAAMTQMSFAFGLILVMGTSVHAETWYLMAADLKVVTNPSVADRLHQGSRLGPLQLTSQGEFASRNECEPARNSLIEAWRKQTVNKRGGWDKYGITSPGGFVRCIPNTDPHLTKSPAGSKEGPSLEAYLKIRVLR
jgi:hypothetical protein